MGRAEDLFERLVREGTAALDALITDRVSEELFLEFKTAVQNGAPPQLQPDDNKNIAKAISGFGNAEGGVVVWGIRDNLTKQPLIDSAAFRARLEAAVSRSTVPPHSGVRSHAWLHAVADTAGYVATLIPKAPFGPLRAKANQGGIDNYYVRAGESFVTIQHDSLAGYFGRVPTSRVWVNFIGYPARLTSPQNDRIHVALGLALYNTGPLLVGRPYVSMQAISLPRPVQLGLQEIDTRIATSKSTMPGNHQVLGNESLVISVGALEHFCNISLLITNEPVDRELRLLIIAGAASAAPLKFELYVTVDELTALQRTAHDALPEIRTDLLLHAHDAATRDTPPF